MQAYMGPRGDGRRSLAYHMTCPRHQLTNYLVCTSQVRNLRPVKILYRPGVDSDSVLAPLVMAPSVLAPEQFNYPGRVIASCIEGT